MTVVVKNIFSINFLVFETDAPLPEGLDFSDNSLKIVGIEGGGP